MNAEPRHKTEGISISEWIAQEAHELSDNGVGLWTVVPAGRLDFGLEGDELIAFVKRAILGLLERGAKPVRGATDGIHYWQIDTHYGTTKEEIADGVIAEWLASGGDDPEWGQFWFALPHTYEERRR
jgi:hypothetical protein